jgi:hypothetical protein
MRHYGTNFKAVAAMSVLADIQKQAGLHAVAYTGLHNYIFDCLAYYRGSYISFKALQSSENQHPTISWKTYHFPHLLLMSVLSADNWQPTQASQPADKSGQYFD